MSKIRVGRDGKRANPAHFGQPTRAMCQNGSSHFNPFLFGLTISEPSPTLHELWVKMG